MPLVLFVETLGLCLVLLELRELHALVTSYRFSYKLR